jgi:hypothetical protein
MERTELVNLRYEDFPVRLFFRLLERSPKVAGRVVGGEKKWERMLQKWEEQDNSLESGRMLEDQIRAMLSLIKAQKATTVLKWIMVTPSDPRPLIEEIGLPWRDDPKELIEAIQAYIIKHTSQYENNLLMLRATVEQQNSVSPLSESKFSIDDAIAGLNLAGFSITEPDKLTIGSYQAMNRAIQRNVKRTT